MKVNKTEAIVKFIFPKFFNVHEECINTMEIRGAEITKLRNQIFNYEKMYEVIEHFNELIAKEKHIYAIERNEKNNDIAIIYNDNVDSHPYDIQIDAYAYLKVDRVFYINALYKEDDNNIFIEDIQNPNNSISKGYGEIGMKYLIELAKKNGINSIYGEITKDDLKDHGDRLVRYYEKFEFMVNIFKNNSGGSIHLALNN